MESNTWHLVITTAGILIATFVGAAIAGVVQWRSSSIQERGESVRHARESRAAARKEWLGPLRTAWRDAAALGTSLVSTNIEILGNAEKVLEKEEKEEDLTEAISELKHQFESVEVEARALEASLATVDTLLPACPDPELKKLVRGHLNNMFAIPEFVTDWFALLRDWREAENLPTPDVNRGLRERFSAMKERSNGLASAGAELSELELCIAARIELLMTGTTTESGT